MLPQTVVSHIPFMNARPIINIPPMHVTTELVTFIKSSGARLFYNNLADGGCKGLQERITGVASAQATTMGRMTPFCPRWRFICLISGAQIHSPALMDPGIS